VIVAVWRLFFVAGASTYYLTLQRDVVVSCDNYSEEVTIFPAIMIT